MATNASFQNMLNQYLPLDLLKQELIDRSYLLQKVTKDESWKGGPLQVPFEVQQASSIEFGQLADKTDISAFKYGRGALTVQPEAWGSMMFNQKDLVQHDGKIPESTFLKILPNQIDAMLNKFKMTLSVHLFGNDGSVANVTVSGTNAGVVGVDRIDRFEIDQKIVLKDSDTAAAVYYVIAIIIDTGKLTVSATRGGAAADVSAYTTGASAKVYHPGVVEGATQGMTSLGSQLLSAANGGPSTIFGVTKIAAPFTQCPNVDGSGVTSSNILSKIFDAYTIRQTLAKAGNLPEVIMSYNKFSAVLKLLETGKGAFNVVAGSRKVSVYGWQEVSIGSVDGAVLKLVAIQEAPETLIYFLDWDGITFYSNGMIRRHKSPDGIEYKVERATTGYFYIIDHFVMGDLVVHAPWKQLVMFNVPQSI
jgi:hypothetical protein